MRYLSRNKSKSSILIRYKLYKKFNLEQMVKCESTSRLKYVNLFVFHPSNIEKKVKIKLDVWA